MSIRFAHTNIIAKDWKRLADFYQKVFACELIEPKRELEGEWLEKGTAIKNAKLQGAHLRLPGYTQDQAPTLEIFQYSENLAKSLPAKANREGFGHIAFQVDEIEAVLSKALKAGAKILSKELVEKNIEQVGKLKFLYILDPEENIVELQSWG